MERTSQYAESASNLLKAVWRGPDVWACVFVTAIAALVRSLSWINGDTSALITFAEKWLDGVDPYLSFHEVNPPASILIYVPAVAIGRLIASPTEAILTVGLFLAAITSLCLAANISRDCSLLTREQLRLCAAPALAILLILPESAFGQREHIALIAIIPALAIFAARASKQTPRLVSTIIAGAGGGVALCIKPFFGLALLLPVLYVVWAHRRRRPLAVLLSPEIPVATLVVAIYLVATIHAFPSYLHVMLPIATGVYMPTRLPWPILLLKPSIMLPILGLAAIAILGLRSRPKPFSIVLVLSTLGFLAATIIQGKGWSYHGYPSIALMLFTGCVMASEGWMQIRATAFSKSNASAFTATLLVSGLYLISSDVFLPPSWYPEFVETVSKTTPPHPKIAALCGGTQYLWPLTRLLKGTAVAHVLWVNDAAIAIQQYDESNDVDSQAVERYARDERSRFLASIALSKPDAIIVCNGWKEWALAQSEFRRGLSKYHNAAALENLQVWVDD